MNMVLVIYFTIGSLVGLACVIAFWFVVYWLKYRLWLRKFEAEQARQAEMRSLWDDDSPDD